MDTKILSLDVSPGYHNSKLQESILRLEKSKVYRDLSTIIICPTRGMISAKVIQSWFALMQPMNQKIIGPFFGVGMEVGASYEELFNFLFKTNPMFYTYKYILTIEDDIIPQPDSLIKLYESIDDYDAVGALYWTKGPNGTPMIYGNPTELNTAFQPRDFLPQVPKEDCVQECNALGMGFTLFKASSFENISEPFFKTEQTFKEVDGMVDYKAMTQDLYFFAKAKKERGWKVACDTRVKVGHWDESTQTLW